MKVNYQEPGAGAIAYALEHIDGLTREQAVPIIRKLLTEMPADPRIKRCATCGYPFRDKTRPNTAVVCDQSTCKRARKTVQKSVQRGRTAKPAKPVVYAWWHEYPFWLSEKAMLRHVGSYERPHAPDKILQISAARQRSKTIGGREGRRNDAKNRRKADF